ncbi:hypothetical protein [Haloferula sp.]|uniref:hypothetical protein n=1 Tax=Haloferula sp. TaxID=2497595 RepID=UPI00329F71BC
MARDPKERPDVAELIRQIESSRSSVGGHVVQLKRSLDIPSRFKHSVTTHPGAWFGGSLGLGLISSRIFRRKPKKTEKKGKRSLLVTTLITLSKPAIKGFLVSEIQRRFKVHTDTKNHGQETQLPLSNPQTPPSN